MAVYYSPLSEAQRAESEKTLALYQSWPGHLFAVAWGGPVSDSECLCAECDRQASVIEQTPWVRPSQSRSRNE